MNRRDFVKTSGALSLSLLNNSDTHRFSIFNKNENTAGALRIPDSLHEQYCSFNTLEELKNYRFGLFNSAVQYQRDRILEPSFLCDTMCYTLVGDGFHAWQLHTTSSSGLQIVGYLDANFPFKSHPNFRQWLAEFAPMNWNDVLMAASCYKGALTGSKLQLVSSHIPHPWLDNLLKDTRGKLFYKDQLAALMNRVAVNNNQPRLFYMGLYQEVTHESLDRLVELPFDDGRQLSQVIDDRCLFGPSGYWHILHEDLDYYFAGIMWEWRNLAMA